jgi:hypothetical protein
MIHFKFVFPFILFFQINFAYGQATDKNNINHDLFVPITQEVPREVKRQYDLLDTIKITPRRHKNKSNIMMIRAWVLDSIYNRKNQSQKDSSLNPTIKNEDFVMLNIPKIGKVKLVIDSIYMPKPIFSTSNIEFKGVFCKEVICHVEGMFSKINELAWTHGGIGGIINIPDQGEIHIINLGNGYQCFAKPYMADMEGK